MFSKIFVPTVLGGVVPSKMTSERSVHPLKALLPIDVTEDGMVIYVIPVTFWNDDTPIVVTEDGMVIPLLTFLP